MADVDLCCNVSICGYDAEDSTLIVKHLKNHIRAGKEISCPYLACFRKFRNLNTFSSHIRRTHRLSIQPREEVMQIDCPIIFGSIRTPQVFSSPSPLIQMDPSVDSLETLRRNCTVFCAMLQYKLLIPGITISKILEAQQKINSCTHASIELAIKNVLQDEGIDQSVIKKVLESVMHVMMNTPVGDGTLQSSYLRERLYKKLLSFVEPLSYNVARTLSQPEPNKESYQYIPIVDSIKALFKYESIRYQYLNPIDPGNYLLDIKDGGAFKKNSFFNQEAVLRPLQIILYQDAFEIVNPLGSAKKKHKILATYFTLGNIHPYCRSKVSPIQLVMLVKEHYVSNECIKDIFSPLLADLKIIEHEGIDLGFSEKVRGSISCILGDNLGSHWIGGFVTNFGTSEYFCRYCSVKRSDFSENSIVIETLRTKESYDQSVNQMLLQVSGNITGIKYDCIFNQLNYFHVCQPSLPPCLAHDIFEGVAQFDMAIFIQCLISKGWFTLDYLNMRISTFHYNKSDSTSKPQILKPNLEKLTGNASQNRAFLRLFPFWVVDKVQDFDDPIWQMIINLRYIVELICAPKASNAIISALQWLLPLYVASRKQLFPGHTVRPKHHYLMHYPELISLFGPLIRCWTLRFEGKHSYFKNVVRRTGNFVNVCKTLAHSHQMMQACMLEQRFACPLIRRHLANQQIVYSEAIMHKKNTWL
ncbi:uncharacterized protein LOC120330222 [Styela clava]